MRNDTLQTLSLDGTGVSDENQAKITSLLSPEQRLARTALRSHTMPFTPAAAAADASLTPARLAFEKMCSSLSAADELAAATTRMHLDARQRESAQASKAREQQKVWAGVGAVECVRVHGA